MRNPLRKAARGRRCTVRLPGCDGGGDTTVLAHYTGSRFRGLSQKVDDAVGAHACANCHDIVDGRKKLSGWSKDEVRLAHAEGCLETIKVLRTLGAL
jgi:hypothetical protein